MRKGRKQRIEKGSREWIERELRKIQVGWNITTSLCLLLKFLKHGYSSKAFSVQLDL